MLHRAMLCYAMPCYVMQCYTVLCYAMLYYAVDKATSTESMATESLGMMSVSEVLSQISYTRSMCEEMLRRTADGRHAPSSQLGSMGSGHCAEVSILQWCLFLV